MTQLERLIEGFATQLGHARHAGRAGDAGRVPRARVARRARACARACRRTSTRWKFGEGDFDRVAFPLLALALVVDRPSWRRSRRYHAATPLLDLADTLLVAIAVIRFAVYVLRHVLPEGGFLRGSERTHRLGRCGSASRCT